MDNLERLAAENARLKAVLSKQGFKITYSVKTGEIAHITAPRRPMPKHTAVTWAHKKNIKTPNSLVRKLTKDKAITERKFKNSLERAELIKDAKEFLKGNGYSIADKFFNKVPTYVLKNTDFYENVNAILNSTAEDDGTDLDNSTINYSMQTSVDRIKRLNQASKKHTTLPTIASSSTTKPRVKAMKPKAKIRIELE
jgi:hypothetical protein